MKASVNPSIFAIALCSILTHTEARAEEKNTTSSNTKTIVLAIAKQRAFETYINEQFTPFTEQEDWNVFVETVTYYNNSPSKFMNVSAERQQQFKNATRLLTHAIENSKDEMAKGWLENLKKTTHNINFIWNLNWDNLAEKEKPQTEPTHQLNGF